MSIWTSLYTGSSGLQAHGDAISVVGDNIANVSTIGYKSARAGFNEVIGGAALNGQNLGNGVRLGGTETSFSQGTLTTTGRGFDLAIRGNGFFAVTGNHEGRQGTFYTRDGRFTLDKSGAVVNPDGLHLQGYAIDSAGVMATSPSELNLSAQSAPRATTRLTLSLNLDSASKVGPAWDPKNPATTSNYATSATVYDSLGAAHRVDVYFRATGNGAWEWHGMVDGGELVGGVKNTPTEVANGTLAFTPNGALNTAATLASSASFTGAVANQAIAFDFGDSIGGGGSGLSGTTQFAGASNVKSLAQDGFGSGALADFTIGQDGTITGRFSNGSSRPLARIGLATVASQAGLQRVGNQLYEAANESGVPLLDPAATGNRGAIANGSLESSNVDLGAELVTLIAYQRAFQANSRTVTTADEMLSEIANLKR